MTEYGLKEDDARIFATDRVLACFFEEVVQKTNDPIKSSNVILSVLLYHMNEDGKNVQDLSLTSSDVSDVILLVNKGDLSMSALKVVLEELYIHGGTVADIIEQKGLKQVNDIVAIEKICKEVIHENSALVLDYKSGKTKVFGAFVGQVMKKSQGKVNPSVVNEILLKLLQS